MILRHPGVPALKRVGGVDDAPHVGRERKERNHVRPGPPPGGDDRRKAGPPGAAREIIEGAAAGVGARARRRSGARAMANGWRSCQLAKSKLCRMRCTMQIWSVVEGKTAASASLHPVQAIGDRDEDVGAAPVS